MLKFRDLFFDADEMWLRKVVSFDGVLDIQKLLFLVVFI